MDRLRKRHQFQRAFNEGRKIITPSLVLFIVPGEPDTLRLGLAVGKKVGKAVIRNRVKRIIREAFRLAEKELLEEGVALKGLDIVAVPRRACREAKSTGLLMEIKERLKDIQCED